MILKFKLTRTIKISKNVALWNTWDHEHLSYVHKQFDKPKILFEDHKSVFIKTKVKIPFTPFYSDSLHTLIKIDDNNVLVIDTLPFNIISRLRMEYIVLGKNKTKLVNHYELFLPSFLKPFKKIIIGFIKKWNGVNWEEDYPLKVRRELALKLGFKDFHGNDPNFKTKFDDNLRLPLPRLKDSILNEK